MKTPQKPNFKKLMDKVYEMEKEDILVKAEKLLRRLEKGE